jgi:hypothetical protein
MRIGLGLILVLIGLLAIQRLVPSKLSETMMHIPRRSEILISALFSALFASATSHPALAQAGNIYIAQNAAGAANGADCADAYSLSILNSASTWGTSAGQIGPGTTVHLCGTFTAPAGSSDYIVVQASGSSVGPITIHFESNATITAPYWSGPVINLGGSSYITVDGGSNGTIQATANGSSLASQQNGGVCVSAAGGSNLIIENLTCANLYVRTTASTMPSSSSCGDADDFGNGITVTGGNSIQIINNVVHDTHWGIIYTGASGGSSENISISGNNVYDVDHGIVPNIGNGTTSTISGIYVFGNHLHDFANWDDASDCDHHDGVHAYDFSGGTMSNLYVYNNLLDGNAGTNENAGIYIESNDQQGTITSCGVFNNIFNRGAGGNASGAIADYSNNGCLDVNNTIYTDMLSVEFTSSTGATIYNNIICATCGLGNGSKYLNGGDGGKFATSDYNDFYPAPTVVGSNSFIPPGGNCCIDTLANWQKATSFDSHSITVNPNLTSSYTPSSSSAVTSGGLNLYSVCNGQPNPGLGALCYDAAGNARPPTGAWTLGAYSATTTAKAAPAPPTGVKGVAVPQ